jgi:hypothetical protein
MTRTGLILAAAALGAFAPLGSAQDYRMESWTIDSGSATLTSGDWTLRSTIGQHDAGTVVSGDFRLEGGFWPGATPDPGCNTADLADPFGVLDLADIVAFITAFGAQDPDADLAEPFGVFDLADIVALVTAFEAGCP